MYKDIHGGTDSLYLILYTRKNTRKLKGMFFISSLALMNFNEHKHSEFDRSMTYEIPSHACFQYIFTSAISLT